MLAPQLRGTGAEIGLWSDATARTPMQSGVRRTGEQRRQRNLAACATTALPLRAAAFHRAARVCAHVCVTVTPMTTAAVVMQAICWMLHRASHLTVARIASCMVHIARCMWGVLCSTVHDARSMARETCCRRACYTIHATCCKLHACCMMRAVSAWRPVACCTCVPRRTSAAHPCRGRFHVSLRCRS